MQNLLLVLVGILGLQYVLYALRMSLYRLALNGRTSPAAESFYEAQMLVAEWVPTGAALLLGLHLKLFVAPGSASGSSSFAASVAELAGIVFVASRLLFGAKVFVTVPHALSVATMTACYVATFVLAGLLILA